MLNTNRQTYLLLLGLLILPVDFHFVYQMRGILGTVLEKQSKERHEVTDGGSDTAHSD